MTGRYLEWHLEEPQRRGGAPGGLQLRPTVYQVPITDQTAPYLAEVLHRQRPLLHRRDHLQPDRRERSDHQGGGPRRPRSGDGGGQGRDRPGVERVPAGTPSPGSTTPTPARSCSTWRRTSPRSAAVTRSSSDLQLDMTDGQLEERCTSWSRPTSSADGSSNFRYRGTWATGSSPWSSAVFYGEEIERVSTAGDRGRLQEAARHGQPPGRLVQGTGGGVQGPLPPAGGVLGRRRPGRHCH